MAGVKHDWVKHVEAATSEGINLKGYAQKHGLGLSTLYRWKRRLHLEAQSAEAVLEKNQVAHVSQAGEPPAAQQTPQRPPHQQPTRVAQHAPKFVALRIKHDEPTSARAPARPCVLSLGAGMRLELPDIPECAWLAGLVRHTQAVA